MFKILFQNLVLFLLILSFISCSKQTEIERHKSPDGQSEAIMIRTEPSGFMKTPFDVEYRDIDLITKVNDKEIKTNEQIWRERPDGEIATDFEKAFKVRKWINNQTFLIGYDENSIKSDIKVSIKNNSSKIIDQAVLRGDGIFVVNQIKPNETVDVPIILLDEDPLRKCRILLDILFSDGVRIPFADGSKLPLSSNEFRLLQTNTPNSKCISGELIVFDDHIDFKL